MTKSNEKTSTGVSSNRNGYQVGVFKDGRLKRIMKMKEGSQYLREKARKLKEDRPKRECSSKQLEALAKGRAIREKNRGSVPGEKKKPGVRARPVSQKNKHRVRDAKALGHNKKAEKSRVRREKEEESGHTRAEDEYCSDSAFSDSSGSE